MSRLQAGQFFTIKSQWKSKFKGQCFQVVRETLYGSVLCKPVDGTGYFYITARRTDDWMRKHIQVVLSPFSLQLEND